jgi:SPP1 family predicted phage head-tail adaptor
MAAGKKRHRISIQRRTDTPDGYGEAVPAWADLVTRYSARIRDDSQREFTANLQVQDAKTIHIEIRDPRLALTPKDRVIWHAASGDRTLDVKAILAGENIGRDITLMCVEHS